MSSIHIVHRAYAFCNRYVFSYGLREGIENRRIWHVSHIDKLSVEYRGNVDENTRNKP